MVKTEIDLSERIAALEAENRTLNRQIEKLKKERDEVRNTRRGVYLYFAKNHTKKHHTLATYSDCKEPICVVTGRYLRDHIENGSEILLEVEKQLRTRIAELEMEVAEFEVLDAPVVAAAEAHVVSKNAWHWIDMCFRYAPESNDSRHLLRNAQLRAYNALDEALSARREAMAKEKKR